MAKNCDDCIKNNRNPNAVGCLECSVVKKKKKKIKDLSFEERKAICKKYGSGLMACFSCPLEIIVRDQFNSHQVIGHKCNLYLEYENNLNDEVEVEE